MFSVINDDKTIQEVFLLFPHFEKPSSHLELFLCRVEDVAFINNILMLKLDLIKGTQEVQSNIFELNLADPYVQKAVMNSIGSYCWFNHTIDFQKIIDQKVLITYRVGSGFRGNYCNLVAIQLISQMKPYVNQKERGNKNG